MTVPQNSDGRRFVWPSDYYSSASPERVLPKGVAFGCGAASVVVLLVIFVGGALVSREGFADFIDFAIGMSLGEMRGQMTKDVTPAQKKTLEDEIERMRANLREQRVSVGAVQPFLQGLQKAGADRRITPAEARSLEQTARRINAAAKAK